jgi:hypothetical protein
MLGEMLLTLRVENKIRGLVDGEVFQLGDQHHGIVVVVGLRLGRARLLEANASRFVTSALERGRGLPLVPNPSSHERVGVRLPPNSR